MSCDGVDNTCIICYDNSMNNIENRELLEYKHCLNVKVHSRCLCLWFIKTNNECLICRNKLDVSHNVLNDTNLFIVNIQREDFTEFDIIYPQTHMNDRDRRINIRELPYLDPSIINYTGIIELINNNINDTVNDIDNDSENDIINDIVNDTVTNNIIRIKPFIGALKIITYLFTMYTFGFCLNIIYNFIFSANSEIF